MLGTGVAVRPLAALLAMALGVSSVACGDDETATPNRDTQTDATKSNLRSDDPVQVGVDGSSVTLLADDDTRTGRLGVMIRNAGSEPFAVVGLKWVNVSELEIGLHAILNEDRLVGSTQADGLDIEEPAGVLHPPDLPYTVGPTGGGEPPAGSFRGTPWNGIEFVFRYHWPGGGEPYAYADLLEVTVASADGSERTVVADTALLMCDDEVYEDNLECETDVYGEDWTFAE